MARHNTHMVRIKNVLRRGPKHPLCNSLALAQLTSIECAGSRSAIMRYRVEAARGGQIRPAQLSCVFSTDARSRNSAAIISSS